jgi:shikimate dehydrogenase
MADLYAVIGNPIGHTKSPMIHMGFARQAEQDIRYIALEAPPGGFSAKVDAFRADGGLGLNITTPFKLDAFAYATETRERARLAGAANAMKFEGSRVIADNFDGIGLERDIRRNLGCPMQGQRVLVLGAGGATRGAILPFLEQHPAQLVVANRTVEKAQALAKQFSPYGTLLATGYEALAVHEPFDLVVNATSASMHDELPPLPARSFAPDCLAYELAYGKGLTPFLRLARQAGVQRLADGVGMLVEQAAEAFAWWRGVRPDTRAMIDQMTIPLT